MDALGQALDVMSVQAQMIAALLAGSLAPVHRDVKPVAPSTPLALPTHPANVADPVTRDPQAWRGEDLETLTRFADLMRSAGKAEAATEAELAKLRGFPEPRVRAAVAAAEGRARADGQPVKSPAAYVWRTLRALAPAHVGPSWREIDAERERARPRNSEDEAAEVKRRREAREREEQERVNGYIDELRAAQRARGER